jgi:DNA-3-methyladenine glycosylase II
MARLDDQRVAPPRAPAMRPAYWDQASAELARRDRVMRRIIRRHAGVSLRRRGTAFLTLARAIVGQQISVAAAASVWARLESATPVHPQGVLATPPERLRACGLSQRKAEYLQDLAAKFASGAVNPRHWRRLDDEALVAELTQVRGIGRWTAEMFLMFHLLRPDVLPLDDLGLRKAVALHYNDKQPVEAEAVRELARGWQPWRSVATWYLWRSLDPMPVEY